MDNTKELVGALHERRDSVKQLRDQLDALDAEKESWYAKKSSFSQQIKEAIARIKELKAKRDLLTAEVKELKGKRDSTNKELKEKRSDLPKETPIPDAKQRGKSPEFLKREIEKIERIIETEAPSFEKEKAYMKQLKQLKKERDAILHAREEINAARQLKSELYDKGKEASTFHIMVMHKAAESQKMHEEIVALSKKIDELKKQETEAFEKFSEHKKSFSEVGGKLKTELGEMTHVRKQLDGMKDDRKEEKRKKDRMSLEEMRKAVEEKMRSGKKLTTDDFKVLQMTSRD